MLLVEEVVSVVSPKAKSVEKSFPLAATHPQGSVEQVLVMLMTQLQMAEILTPGRISGQKEPDLETPQPREKEMVAQEVEMESSLQVEEKESSLQEEEKESSLQVEVSQVQVQESQSLRIWLMPWRRIQLFQVLVLERVMQILQGFLKPQEFQQILKVQVLLRQQVLHQEREGCWRLQDWMLNNMDTSIYTHLSIYSSTIINKVIS